MDLEIVQSFHEAANAVASVRLGLSFDYVTLDDPTHGSHVHGLDNVPRAIPFYGGHDTCCASPHAMCDRCIREQERTESCMIVALCGGLGVALSGCGLFGYRNEADLEYVALCCQDAFGDATVAHAMARIRTLRQRAEHLMSPEVKTVTAVAAALRTQRRLTEADVTAIMHDQRDTL
jgi:hypothetical protein